MGSKGTTEGLWNSKKRTLLHLHSKLSRPSSKNSDISNERRVHSDKIRTIEAFVEKKKIGNIDDSFSSDDLDASSQMDEKPRKKKSSKKKSNAVTLTINPPQPPGMYYTPPPMHPMYMPTAMPFGYPMPYVGYPQQSPVIPVSAPSYDVGGKSKKSNLKQTDDSEDTDLDSIPRRNRKMKKVRILEVKKVADAETITDEPSTSRSSIKPSSNVGKILEEIKNGSDGSNVAIDWDSYFQPRVAPPLVFEQNERGDCASMLSMLSNTNRTNQSMPSVPAGQFSFETSNGPAPTLYQPAIKDNAGESSLTQRTILAEEESVTETRTSKSERRRSKNLTPIAEEVLKSYDVLKADHYGDINDNLERVSLESELDVANKRLSRYFNQLKDLDNFILDQESRLLDKQQHAVEKNAQVKALKTFSVSPRSRRKVASNFVISSPQAPPPKNEHLKSLAAKNSTTLMNEVYSSIERPNESELMKELKKSVASKQQEDAATSMRRMSSVYGSLSVKDRFNTDATFADWLLNEILDDLLEEILVFEVGRTTQEISVEAVSAMIERKLAEDLEEKRAMTRKIIERLPSPKSVMEKAYEQSEITAARLVSRATESSAKATSMKLSAHLSQHVSTANLSSSHSSSPIVEDIDLFFRELTLPRTAESIIKGVIDVDLKLIIKDLILEQSVEMVADDFLINQVVAVEMLDIASEAIADVERRKKRTRRRQLKDSIEGQVLHSQVLDICLTRVAQQSLILSPFFELDIALYDSLLYTLLGKLVTTQNTRTSVAECLPMRRFHERIVTDIATDAVVNELVKSLDIDMAEVDDFETGRDMELASSSKTPSNSHYY